MTKENPRHLRNHDAYGVEGKKSAKKTKIQYIRANSVGKNKETSS